MTSKQPFVEMVSRKAERKLKAKEIDSPGIWFGLGMMGLIGWSVSIPTLIGTALGIWLDRHYPGGHTYTLALLIAGLCLGCFNAWHWLGKEQCEIHAPPTKKMMNDNWPLILSVTTGLGLGLIFYGGLYVTVTRGLSSKHPVLWFLGSLLLRMSLVLTGFYFISDGHWQRIIACLSGFMVTGIVFQVWKSQSPTIDHYSADKSTTDSDVGKEIQHADNIL